MRKLWILQFFRMPKREIYKTLQLQCFEVFQIAKSKSRSMCGLDVQIWKMKIWQLCHQCIQIIFFTYDALTIVGRQFWRSDKCLILVCKNWKNNFRVLVPSFILMYFASVKFVSKLLTNFSPPDKLLKRRVAGLCTYVLVADAYVHTRLCFLYQNHLDTATIKPAVLIDIEKPSDMSLTVITNQITRLILK